MLLATAQTELFLLVFSLLVPCGIVALGLAGVFRGVEADLGQEVHKKADALLTIPAVLVIAGLCAAVAHVGYPAHIFGMASGFGASPLSNEIVVAGVSSVAALVYWIVSLAKHPQASVHKAFGAVVLALGVLTAIMTGFAYMMPTIPTWNTPLAWAGQLFNALMGGGMLAALVLAAAGVKSDFRTMKLVAACTAVGVVGAAVCVLAQGAVASGAVSSAGATLAAAMGSYYGFAVAAIVCAVAGLAAWLVPASKGKENVAFMVVALVLIAIALVLIRIDFYGIFLSVGLQ